MINFYVQIYENAAQVFYIGASSGGEELKKEVVFVYRDGIAKVIEVETGISDYDNIEILDGIEPGDQVVSGPFLVVSRRLKDGDAVVSDEENEDKNDDSDEEESESD